MKKLTLSLSTLVALTAVVSQATAQVPTPVPSEHHKILTKDVGTWEAEIKSWMAGPDAAPEVMKGVETNRMMGDFWSISEFEGEFMGQKFNGHGVFGYDEEKQKFVGTWCDSMTSYLSFMEGTYDEASKTMTMSMTNKDPATGAEIEGKNVTVHKDAKTRVMTMYNKMNGEFVKMMEITYTKR